jgi:M6 family metalloprotease-like protein
MTAAGADKLLILKKQKIDEAQSDNRIIQRGLTPDRYRPDDLQLKRKHPWSLPTEALADNAQHTIKVLVLRYDFQEEIPDDPNTTGRGVMNLADLPATPADSQAYLDSVGHFIDPPPHDSAYFHAHLRALSMYWEKVSEGKINLSWDIFPPGKNSRYQLPHPMSYYGKCPFDSVVFGLERFFIDCIHLADSVSPEISFSNYEAFFLFHAGSDRQNDVGFPETCSDLFTGFIHYYPDPARGFDTLWVDSGTHFVETALLMPETASQDNRATALNAVLAHEFGHQLGLVDLYRTDNFMSQLGDFALMDNNGFGTGIETPWRVGRVFGAMPLYASAWSRAYLGYVEVHDFRQGSDIRTVAAEVVSSGIKIARIPISENEYYLIENRMQLIDPGDTILWLDSTSGVILGPGNENHEFTGDYDFLMPGSGLLIFHVDERVAGLDYDGDGMNNFDDNDLQSDPNRPFIRLVEADGLVNFGGYYRSGYGSEKDMFRDDRNNSFTPNTNPPAIDNSGNNTRIRITNITRDTVIIGDKPQLLDSVILFDLETDKLATGFPVRAGQPIFGLSPVVDDLDRDGTDELIVVSGRDLLVFTTTGENFLRKVTGCESCPVFYDTAKATVHSDTSSVQVHALPLYARVSDNITASPVVGDFSGHVENYVAIGYPVSSSHGQVNVYRPRDVRADGQADILTNFSTLGVPIALSFGDVLWVLTNGGKIYRKTRASDTLVNAVYTCPNEEYHGICRIGQALVLMAGDEEETRLYYFNDRPQDTISFSLSSYYNLGPILVDVEHDSRPEIAAFSPEGRAVLVTVDNAYQEHPSFSVLREVETGFHVTTNPIAGDVDNDGYPDIIIGGTNAIYAFNQELILKTGFPIEINDRFPDDEVIAAPVMADIEKGGQPEVVFPTFVGNVYSFGSELSYGFPLSGGEQVRGSDSTGWSGGYFGAGSPVVFSDSTGGKLGYLGADGWFYAWDVDQDSTTDYWPMGGHDPAGTYAFDQSQLSEPRAYTDLFPKERFYNWPNPVTEGRTRIRYFLGKDAQRVEMKIYDLSGQEIDVLTGSTSGGTDNECTWNCADVTPGVYRCVIEVDFGGQTEKAFTDIAVIR